MSQTRELLTCHNSIYEKILQCKFLQMDSMQSFVRANWNRMLYECYYYLLIMNNSPFYRVFAQAAMQVCERALACAYVRTHEPMRKCLKPYNGLIDQTSRHIGGTGCQSQPRFIFSCRQRKILVHQYVYPYVWWDSRLLYSQLFSI